MLKKSSEEMKSLDNKKNRFLVRIEAPHFTAGLISDHNKVISAAPILRWTYSYSIPELKGYFSNKGWKFILVDSWLKEGEVTE